MFITAYSYKLQIAYTLTHEIISKYVNVPIKYFKHTSGSSSSSRSIVVTSSDAADRSCRIQK